jgi:hypothetical protein
VNQINWLSSAAGALVIAAPALATPRESAQFTNVNSNGVLNSAANTVLTHDFVGGYALGRIDLSGTLTSVNSNTWRSDSRILITAPDGVTTYTFQPFSLGGTYTTLNFSSSIFLPTGTNPAGTWTFRFYEYFDDGGTASIDARWNLSVTLTDEPPAPPASTNLGTAVYPGSSVSGVAFTAGQIKWFSFTVPAAVPGAPGRFLDLDTFGSVLADSFPNDTTIGLYDSTGVFIAQDDDSCAGFTSQLSFGAGVRPPTGDGVPYDGRNGSLSAGVYYLAVGAYPSTFGPIRWDAHTAGTVSGTVAVRLNTNTGGPCYGNCDGSTTVPILNVNDFTCFLQKFATGDPYANCDGSTTIPILNVTDFTCFLQKFAQGCP